MRISKITPTSPQMAEQLRMVEFMLGLQAMRDFYDTALRGIWGWRP
jgi:hypothetical protein